MRAFFSSLIFLVVGLVLNTGALADCEGGFGRVDYDLKNIWFELEQNRIVHFKGLCEVHDACYRVLGSDQDKCDDEFKRQIDELCDRTFREGTRPYGNCHIIANGSYVAVLENGSSVFSAVQRELLRDERAQKRKTTRKKRRKLRADRRAKRRREAYRKIYEEEYGIKKTP
jgi:hypothetical protein